MVDVLPYHRNSSFAIFIIKLFLQGNTNCKLSYLAKHNVTDEMRLQDKLIFTLLQKKKEMEAYAWWGSKLLFKLSTKISYPSLPIH